MKTLNAINSNIIFNRLDSIENKTGKMAHEIDELKDKLRAWQDGDLKDSFFMNYLARKIDQLNS